KLSTVKVLQGASRTGERGAPWALFASLMTGKFRTIMRKMLQSNLILFLFKGAAMRWQDLRPSSNVEDVRGGGRGLAMGGGGIGILILALVVWLCGGDPRQLLENLPSQTEVQQQQPSASNNQPADQNKQFAAAILGSTEDVWSKVLPQQARVRYTAPKLVLYSGQISPACGYASAAMGPF